MMIVDERNEEWKRLFIAKRRGKGKIHTNLG